MAGSDRYSRQLRAEVEARRARLMGQTPEPEEKPEPEEVVGVNVGGVIVMNGRRDSLGRDCSNLRVGATRVVQDPDRDPDAGKLTHNYDTYASPGERE